MKHIIKAIALVGLLSATAVHAYVPIGEVTNELPRAIDPPVTNELPRVDAPVTNELPRVTTTNTVTYPPAGDVTNKLPRAEVGDVTNELPRANFPAVTNELPRVDSPVTNELPRVEYPVEPQAKKPFVSRVWSNVTSFLFGWMR
mgnify:CR=1 FL=1